MKIDPFLNKNIARNKKNKKEQKNKKQLNNLNISAELNKLSTEFNKLKKKYFKHIKLKREQLIKIIIVLLICIFITASIKFIDYELNYVKHISDDGLSLLNEYEFPWYMVDESGSCMEPYDIDDGVITFGPGVTYPTLEEGISDINERFNTQYSPTNKCINLDILFDLQSDIMVDYEKVVYNFAYKYKLKLSQNEFDSLVLLSYNSPDFLKNEGVIKMLNSNPEQAAYIEAIDNYYKTLNSYYDNPITNELNDGYGEGWYRRIVDSSEVYFFSEYDYQNSF